jgi:hypothetical protein
MTRPNHLATAGISPRVARLLAEAKPCRTCGLTSCGCTDREAAEEALDAAAKALAWDQAMAIVEGREARR